jgi:hypothetical protein
MKSKHLLILLSVVVLTRLPFLSIGYGADADAWRVAHSASLLWNTGVYEPSRFPGFPLHEVLSAPFVGIGDAPLSNTATLIACLLLLLAWQRVTLGRTNHQPALVIAMAFAPLVWKNSSVTMDYIWSLLGIVLSLASALRKEHWHAGFWIGVAAGFRPLNFIAIFPLASLLYFQRTTRKQMLAFFATALATTIAAFLPLIAKYGVLGWVSSTLAATSDISIPLSERILQFGYRSVTSIGIPATIASICIVLLRRHSFASEIRQHNPFVIASLGGLIVFTGLYFWFPLEREYLLPAFPFGFLLLDRIATRRDMLIFVTCLLSFVFVNFDVIEHHGFKGSPGLNVHAGIVIEEFDKREYIPSLRESLGKVSVGGQALVMTGGDMELWFDNPALAVDTSAFWRSFGEPVFFQKRNLETRFIRVLTQDEIRKVREMGYIVYCGDWNKEYIERISGYVMEDEGVRILYLNIARPD